ERAARHRCDPARREPAGARRDRSAIRRRGRTRAPRGAGAGETAGGPRLRQHPALCESVSPARDGRHARHRHASLGRQAALFRSRIRGMGREHHRHHALRPGARSEMMDTRTKLSAARTRLILERPFIGALVMHLPLRAADPRWCETVATDARALYFNPEYVSGLDFGEAQFVLAHEALHCALGHFARRGHRVKARWDIAADHAVNLLLADEGLKPPPGA